MKLSEPLILTLDAGTTGVKCAVFREDAASVFSRTEGYPTLYPHPGWAQQRPKDILDAAVRAIRAALAAVSAGGISALVFTGTMNGCLPLDASGEPLYDNIIHSDVRTEEEVLSIASLIPPETFYGITGNRIDVHSGLPKYLWLRGHEPDVYRKTRWFVNIKDYLYGCATGLYGRTDYSDASLCSCLDLRKKDWAWGILNTLGILSEKMPALFPSADVSGSVTAAFSRMTGLPQGLPVAMGGGDGACAAHGARKHEYGAAYMNIGSSAWVSAMSPGPVIDREARIFSYIDLDPEACDVCGTVQCGAAAFDWAAEHLLGVSGKQDYALLEQTARTVPPGAEGVFFLPTMMGERTPWWTSRASGTLTGLTLYHERKHIVRAVYEGVMQALSFCAAILQENGLPCSSLMLIGGGADSALWGQMAASMMNAEVRIHQTPREASSLGAAFAAGVGIGLYKNYQEAAACLRARSVFSPDPEEHAAYQAQAGVYRRLYPAMKDAYSLIYDHQQSHETQKGTNSHGKASL